MFVTASARRRGHARRLLAELERIAVARSYRRMRLLSTEVLTEARALYESSGYQVVKSWIEDGHPDVWLEKSLL